MAYNQQLAFIHTTSYWWKKGKISNTQLK